MPSIIRYGDTYHGISVSGVSKDYAEYGPDGKFDGRYFGRSANGTTGYYRLFERGKEKANARVFADGRCTYNYYQCAPDDPRLLALIAQVAPVEVRRASRAPHPPLPCHSPPSNRPMCRLGLLQALAQNMASEVHTQ
jgi:hypothetical protein